MASSNKLIVLDKEIDDVFRPVEQPKRRWRLFTTVALAIALAFGATAYYFAGLLPSDSAATQDQKDLKIKGNRASRIYHLPRCPNYDDIAPNHIVWFKTHEEAKKAGYRMARNC